MSILTGTRLAAIDTETTGFDAREHAVIEVAWVEIVDGELGEEWSSLVRPGRDIPKGATDIHGIRDDDVRDAPGPAEVAAELARRCEGLPLVFHNAPFDLPFLVKLMKEGGRPPLLNPIVDTLGLARGVSGAGTSNPLQELVKRFGLLPEKAHRALGDTRSTARVFKVLAREWEEKKGVRSVAELAAESQDVVRRTSRRR